MNTAQMVMLGVAALDAAIGVAVLLSARGRDKRDPRNRFGTFLLIGAFVLAAMALAAVE